jgi:hypothetical protein
VFPANIWKRGLEPINIKGRGATGDLTPVTPRHQAARAQKPAASHIFPWVRVIHNFWSDQSAQVENSSLRLSQSRN